MVLAELAGLVAQRLQHGGERHGLVRHADIGAGLADRRQAGAQRQLAGDEVGAAGGAARLGIVVGEAHALGGELVEVRRLAGHDALVIGADVEPADIVAHDDEDVGLGPRMAPPVALVRRPFEHLQPSLMPRPRQASCRPNSMLRRFSAFFCRIHLWPSSRSPLMTQRIASLPANFSTLGGVTARAS